MRVTLYFLYCGRYFARHSFEVCFEVYLFVVNRKSPYPKASSLYNYTWNISISTLLISVKKISQGHETYSSSQ